jgi:rfaE bifunctional protein kinase chain/domain
MSNSSNSITDWLYKQNNKDGVVFVSGNFNIIHPGHLRLLKFAADCGNYLIVGINPDTFQGVSLPAPDRLLGVEAVSFVDYAVILDQSTEEVIEILKPEIVVKGKEYEGISNVELDAVLSYGGKLLFNSGEIGYSSIDLLKTHYYKSHFSNIEHQYDFCARRNVNIQLLKEDLYQLSGIKVAVVGDLIIDEYIDCDPLGMSNEDPTIVVTPINSEKFLGGAGIVAAHCSGLGADVTYFGLVGEDENHDFAEQKLKEYSVESVAVVDNSRPTTLKIRYRANGKTLLRVSVLKQHTLEKNIEKILLKKIMEKISTFDLLIFSDFNYGCLSQSVVDRIQKESKKNGVMVTADSQASSQLSDISRFCNTELLTPTEKEVRLSLHDYDSGIVVLADKLIKKTNANNVIITMGSEGMLLQLNDKGEYKTDKIAALNTTPKDPAGAGDSVLAMFSMCLCRRINIWKSAYLSSLAAACQVSRVGNTPLTVQDIITELNLE